MPYGNIWAMRELEAEMIEAGVDPIKYLGHAARSWVPTGGPLPFGPYRDDD